MASERDDAPERIKARYSPSLLGWCADGGLKHLESLGTREMTQWRSTWRMEPLAESKRQGIVCGFLLFLRPTRLDYKNPMLDVGSIKVTEKPTSAP